MSPLILKDEWVNKSPDPLVTEQLKPIMDWHKQREENLERLEPHTLPQNSFVAMFHGPVGSGKKMTTATLAKSINNEVYRIYLSNVVSKYIGETEKNISQVFDTAKNKDWILFFDEADALFGKRTEVQDAHDRYSSQEVNYLLQQAQQYKGLSILSTSGKEDIDESFARRLHCIVKFPGKV